MKQDRLNHLAYCGLYCGACSFKVAFQENNRRHLKGMPEKYDHLLEQEMTDCAGCRVDTACGDCGIKSCAQKKSVVHCGECPEFPCEKIHAFANDGIPHHAEILQNFQRIKEIGTEQWVAEQTQKYQCSCGKKRSWYVKDCVHSPEPDKKG